MVFCFSRVLVFGGYIKTRAHVHGWYKPLYLVPILLAVWTIAFRLNKKAILSLLILILLRFYQDFAAYSYAATTGSNQVFHGFLTGARTNMYLAVGRFLYKKYPDAILMTSEVGGLGYGFRGKILDAIGLIQPDCLKYHPMRVPEEHSNGPIGAIPRQCEEENLPEIIVSCDIFMQSLAKSKVLKPYFHYALPIFLKEDLQVSPIKELWGSGHLNVYIRKDLNQEIDQRLKNEGPFQPF